MSRCSTVCWRLQLHERLAGTPAELCTRTTNRPHAGCSSTRQAEVSTRWPLRPKLLSSGRRTVRPRMHPCQPACCQCPAAQWGWKDAAGVQGDHTRRCVQRCKGRIHARMATHSPYYQHRPPTFPSVMTARLWRAGFTSGGSQLSTAGRQGVHGRQQGRQDAINLNQNRQVANLGCQAALAPQSKASQRQPRDHQAVLDCGRAPFEAEQPPSCLPSSPASRHTSFIVAGQMISSGQSSG